MLFDLTKFRQGECSVYTFEPGAWGKPMPAEQKLLVHFCMNGFCFVVDAPVVSSYHCVTLI